MLTRRLLRKVGVFVAKDGTVMVTTLRRLLR
jgi:hypothetical protein